MQSVAELGCDGRSQSAALAFVAGVVVGNGVKAVIARLAGFEVVESWDGWTVLNQTWACIGWTDEVEL